MKHINIREAKATLTALVDAAEGGDPITITRHGKPVAALVPISDADKLYPEKPSLAEYLLSFPGWPEGFELERDRSQQSREVDL
ncbi:prevent-host-death family protein [Mesorhizobium albiziae]|uniref:Antitoxin n=1 Tax=Neomesorhizobium albiziae TaxID=335020 RepID=A0A1I4EQV5_9HYPH|nr:type II toxin-antitoxin system Phd/YefM family antitoxin [Mesorhizobium albiziae]GLS30811.1 antitoxin [Mesorhizobium albiziae]SFL08064.1 prevent-host-death family protein [Mesorhizobium albiziae]